jgi:hypothetical protein
LEYKIQTLNYRKVVGRDKKTTTSRQFSMSKFFLNSKEWKEKAVAVCCSIYYLFGSKADGLKPHCSSHSEIKGGKKSRPEA